MKRDIDAIGGFFEDLPVMAFVLAGALSVAGVACWTSERLAEDADIGMLERSASLMVDSIMVELGWPGDIPSAEGIRSANLSESLTCLENGLASLVSIWCVHPRIEPLLVMGEFDGYPATASSDGMRMNVLCVDGIVGIMEVRVLVWAN